MTDRYDEFRSKNKLKFLTAKLIFVCLCISIIYIIYYYINIYLRNSNIGLNTYFCNTNISNMSYKECSKIINNFITIAKERKIILIGKKNSYILKQKDFMLSYETVDSIISKIKNNNSFFNSYKIEYNAGIKINSDKLIKKLKEINNIESVLAKNAFIRKYDHYSKLEFGTNGFKLNINPILKILEKDMKFSNKKVVKTNIKYIIEKPQKNIDYYINLYNLNITLITRNIFFSSIENNKKEKFDRTIKKFNNIILNEIFNFNSIANITDFNNIFITELLPSIFYDMCLNSAMIIVARKHKNIFMNMKHNVEYNVKISNSVPFIMKNKFFKKILIKISNDNEKYTIKFIVNEIPYEKCYIYNEIKEIPFKIKKIQNKKLAKNEIRLIQKGIKGLNITVKRIIKFKESSKEQVISVDNYEPVKQVILYN